MRKILLLFLFAVTSFHAQSIEHPEAFKKCRKEFNKKVCLADEDKDNIPFYFDKCPKEGGPIENYGCPWPDTDKDGVLDKDDVCPSVIGPVENKGCPWEDTDGDGILDKDDNCPTVLGPANTNGCRVISCSFDNEPDILMEKVDMDVQNIEKIYNLVNKKVLDHVIQKLPKKDFAGQKTFLYIQYISPKSYIDDNTPDDGLSPGYNFLITRFWNKDILEYAHTKYDKSIYISTAMPPEDIEKYHTMIGNKTFNYMMKYYDSESSRIKIPGKRDKTFEIPMHIAINFITPYKIKVSSYQNNNIYEYKNSQWELLKE